MAVLGHGRSVARPPELPPVVEDLAVEPGPEQPWARQLRRRVIRGDLGSALVALSLVAGSAHSVARDRLAQVVLLTVAAALVWLCLLVATQAYDLRLLCAGQFGSRRVAGAGVYLFAGAATISAFAQDPIATRTLLAFATLVTALSLCSRGLVRGHLRRARRSGRCLRRALVVGHEDQLSRLNEVADDLSDGGLSIVAACVPSARRRYIRLGEDVLVAGDFNDIAGTARRLSADVVAVAPSPEMTTARLRLLRRDLEASQIDLTLLASLAPVLAGALRESCSGVQMLHLDPTMPRGARPAIKWVLDRVLAAMALLVLWPFFLAIGIAVRATSPGPAMFHQTRVGRDGRTFTMLKFRTMVQNAEELLPELSEFNDHTAGALFKMRHDPRTTRVGGWLRRYSLDELPQLVNVLKGDMSLVGPRPPLPSEVAVYEDVERLRLQCRPGLTGLWQVSGRSDLSWERSVQLDLRYVETWSLGRDFAIMWRTFASVWRGTGAY